ARDVSTITKAQVNAALRQLDTFIQDAQAQTGVPGVAVAVVYKDQVVYVSGFGVRDTSASAPVTPDTVFQLASLSKSTGSTVAAALPTGKSWEELSKEKLYTPLGMTHTSSSNADLLKEPNVAKLHVKVDGHWVALVTRQPDAQSPAGGVSSTARDLAQWLRLQ